MGDISKKVQESRLKLDEHVLRREEDHARKRVMKKKKRKTEGEVKHVKIRIQDGQHQERSDRE